MTGASTYAGSTTITSGVLQLGGGPLSGIVAAYTFSNPNDLGEDFSGLGNNLISEGDPQYAATGPFGNAVYLDGGSSLDATVFPTGVPTGGEAYTVAAWIDPAANDGNGGWVGWGNNGNTDQTNNFRMNGSNSVDNYWWGNDYVQNLNESLANAWHFVVFTYNSTTNQRTLYVDGSLVGNYTSSGLDAAANAFAVGMTTNSEHFIGYIGNITILDRAVSPAEVLALMASPFGTSSANVLPVGTALNVLGSGTLDLNGISQEVASLADPSGGGSVINTGTGAVTLTLNPSAGTTTFAGVIGGGGGGSISLDQTGAGTQVLSGINTYTGTTTISGALVLGNDAATGSGTVTMVAGGTLDFAPGITSPVLGGLAGTANITLDTAASEAVALNVGSDNSNTSFGGNLNGSGSLTKVGTGTLTVAAAQTYTGATVINAGTLQLAGQYQPPSGTQAFYQFNNPANLGQDSSGNGNELITATGDPTYSSSGVYGGALYLNGSSTLTTNGFPTGVPTGGTSYTIALWEKNNGSGNNGGFVGWGDNSGNLGNNFRFAGPNALNNYWYGNDLQVNGLATNPMDGNWHFVAVTWNSTTGLQTLYVDGVDVYSDTRFGQDAQPANFVVGKTTADINFTGWMDDLLIANVAFSQSQITALMNETGAVSNILPITTALSIAASGTLDMAGNNQQVASLSGSGSVINSASGAVSLTLSPSAGSTTFSGVIGGGSGSISLTENGTGTQILTGINTFTGSTTITSGTLEVDGSIVTSPSVTVNTERYSEWHRQRRACDRCGRERQPGQSGEPHGYLVGHFRELLHEWQFDRRYHQQCE